MNIKNLKAQITDKYHWYNYRRAHDAFKEAVPFRQFLPDDAFPKFIKEYGKIPYGPNNDYSVAGMEKLTTERINLIFNKVRSRPESMMEIGPGAGFVLKRFKEEGIKRVVALDIVDGLYPEVKQAGVELLLSSADNMNGVPDKSFDLVVSWNALEHIPNPQKVFGDCLRILKPGGYLYMAWGPHFYSPWGYHQYSVMRCPYLHILFPESLIHEYARKVRGDDYAPYLPWTNGEAVDAYDFLKKPLSYDYLLESFGSGFDYYSSKMITSYPEVFKSKNVPFESFFVDWTQIGIYRKK